MTRDELIALLRSWHDFFPLPATWTGELQRRSAPRGPAPFRRVECGKCEGRGKLRGGWPCDGCKGRGAYWVDDYTSEQVDWSDTSWAQLLSGTVDCSTCGGWGRLGAYAEERPDQSHALCPRCEGTGKVSAPLTNRADIEPRPRQGDRTLDALDDQAQRRDRVHAYQELAKAMDELQEKIPGVHFVICWIYVLEVQPPTPANAAAIEVGLTLLLDRLKDVDAPYFIERQAELQQEAKVAAKGKSADRRAQAVRNEEIRRRHAAGATGSELAATFNLDKGQVSRIVSSR